MCKDEGLYISANHSIRLIVYNLMDIQVNVIFGHRLLSVIKVTLVRQASFRLTDFLTISWTNFLNRCQTCVV